MRDHTKLKVFELADRLALRIYRESSNFPISEMYGLRLQIRRASVSIASNIVEGCARNSQADYARFLEIAFGSARELQYQIGFCRRLGLLQTIKQQSLHADCTELVKALNGLLCSLRR